MVKCLIRITTRVNVHLRMINHCYRDVKVRVLSLGPRMLGKALGVLPLYPALTGQQESASVTSLPGTPLPCVQPTNPPGKLITEPARGVLYMEVPAPFSSLNQCLPHQTAFPWVSVSPGGLSNWKGICCFFFLVLLLRAFC